MEYSLDDLRLQLRQLQDEVADLRRRVLSLEPETQDALTTARVPAVRDGGDGDRSVSPVEAIAPLFGWAFLGLSGAYLLRAATESGAIPNLAGVSAGIVYAGWWIFLAARHAAENRAASTVYSITAVLILAPLVWEATVRFQTLGAPLASTVLVAFTIFGFAIGWRHRVTGMATVAALAALVTSIALYRASHDAISLVISVLVIAAAVEFSACRDHWLGLRWVAAITAGLAVLTVTVRALRPAGSAEGAGVIAEPVALGAQSALLCIYLTSTAHRTLVRRLPISVFEILQATAVFAIGIGGALSLRELPFSGSLAAGLFCGSCSLACYRVAYSARSRDAAQNRNFYVFSTFAAALLGFGGKVLFPGAATPVAWACAAAVLAYAGSSRGHLTLRIHAAFLLVLSTVASGAMQSAKSWLIQQGPPPVSGAGMGYIAVLGGSLFAYAAMLGFGRKVARMSSWEAVLPAGVFLWLTSGFAALFMPRLAAGSVLRMALLTAVAIAAARIAAVADRQELAWVSYGFVAAAGFKLFVEDFRAGGSLGVFASLTLFGGTLIVLPKLRKAPRRQSFALSVRA